VYDILGEAKIMEIVKYSVMARAQRVRKDESRIHRGFFRAVNYCV
jgi:hypothetical protein